MSGRTQPMTATHTPTPWEWDSGIVPPDGPGRYCDIYVDGGDIIIANINDCIPQGEANAAFIVEAVNSHEALKARIQELESNERAYEKIIGPMTHQEVAAELASCRECRAKLDCLSRGAVPVRDDGAERIRKLEDVIALAVEYLQKNAERRTIMLSQSSWTPKRSTVEADRNAFVSVENTLRAALQPKDSAK
jgi:hypothetical protein